MADNVSASLSHEKLEKTRETVHTQSLSGIVRMFKVLSDQTRMKLLYVLCLEEEMCVSDISKLVGCSISSASHHLRSLRRLGFVSDRNVGKSVMYSIKNDRLKQMMMLALESSQ
ncbi:metalloregulator ArsR/SmtB family transcription factor [Paenibacillus sp. LMG 31458]|uniref:Metalloregulator ArsR/SmtB family transcription factor n=1 Tax=Paenibacillus phytorum TaxID=2654977 RepID=A0ABX1XY02_9BACL|nr:metalloregulator ArsR/SmtB family transcription factor [Paenibacillus phytorum]NOU73450.1 metalloregulator ArsR/SmtB family transcription factor [Paenibacillus phytorum]